MEDKQIKMLGEMLKVYCEVEGMRAANMERQFQGGSMEYHEGCFLDAAMKIERLIWDIKTT